MRHEPIHGTTILAVRRDGRVAMGGDGQITVGDTVMKANATKVRALKGGKILAGFAGAAADAFTLFEKFEEKLERYPGNISRAAVELAKDWRSDRVLRRLEALLTVADKESSPSARAGVTPWPRRGRCCRARSSVPRKSCRSRWRSRPKSACIPTPTSPYSSCNDGRTHPPPAQRTSPAAPGVP